MHSYTHSSATVWIYVLSYRFNCPDVIAIALHILNLSDTDINAFIQGFITSVEEIMFLFPPVCQQEMFPAVSRHKDNWLNWTSDTGFFSCNTFLSLPLQMQKVIRIRESHFKNSLGDQTLVFSHNKNFIIPGSRAEWIIFMLVDWDLQS